MSMLENVTRALGNCRSVQLSYGVFESTQGNPGDFEGLAHTSPTPELLPHWSLDSAICVIRPLARRSVGG